MKTKLEQRNKVLRLRCQLCPTIFVDLGTKESYDLQNVLCPACRAELCTPIKVIDMSECYQLVEMSAMPNIKALCDEQMETNQ